MNDLVNLVNGWRAHFWSADREITWVGAEEEASVWLTPNTLLMGRLDARGISPTRERFFGEWKTANPRERLSWKNVWRLNPQSLTYGLLADALDPGCRRFTVRKAFKSDPPSYDHAWFAYSDTELAMWRAEVIRIADEVRGYHSAALCKATGKHEHPILGMDDAMQLREAGAVIPWPLNLSNCFRYGEKYACPFFKDGCNKQDWVTTHGLIARVPHLDVERRLNAPDNLTGGYLIDRLNDGIETRLDDVIALDATRISTWLGCRERYRREYVDNVVGPPGEALTLGIEFHAAMGTLYKGMVRT